MQKKIKVLIIDDDDVDIRLMIRAIEASGCHAEWITASGSDTGERMATQENPDCIFLDYNLPGSNGLKLLQRLNSLKSDIPVVIVTGRGDESVAAEAIKLGARDYIPKNKITPDAIHEILHRVVRPRDTNHNRHEPQSRLDVACLADHSPVIQFLVDPSGIIKVCSGQWIQKLAFTTGEIENTSIFDLAGRIPVSVTDFEHAMAGAEITGEIELNERIFTVHYVPMRNASDEVHAVSVFAIDFTESKKSETALKLSLTEAEELRKIKESFLANMSHEIRTPIHGILNLSDILLKTQLEAEQRKFLDAIKKSADSLLVIINDILDISKIEANKMTIENTPFNLREVIHTIYDLFKPRSEEHKINLEVNLDEALPETVVGDSVRFSQIINNLVNNAIKFTERGFVSIDVSMEESNDHFCIITTRISDSGMGIPNHKLQSIFDSFMQASDDITRKYGGTGLGLSICRKLVEMQGGMIDVESELNRGSVFTFRLPFEIVTAGQPATAKENNSPTPDRQLHVLVVEDNEINQLVVNKILKDWGFTADMVANGQSAIHLVGEHQYDIVLMDIEMPGINGYEATRIIRQSEAGARLPILAMTAHANAEEKEKCLNAGMNDYISKPFKAGELWKKISTLTHAGPESTTANEGHGDSKINQDVTSTEAKVTNLNYLRLMSEENEDFFREFIKLFLDNTPAALQDLVSATEANDWESVRYISHKIKPSLSYIGMKEMHQVALTLEQNAKNETDLDSIPLLVKRLDKACRQAFKELEAELKAKV